jgi:hypothetical protein
MKINKELIKRQLEDLVEQKLLYKIIFTKKILDKIKNKKTKYFRILTDFPRPDNYSHIIFIPLHRDSIANAIELDGILYYSNYDDDSFNINVKGEFYIHNQMRATGLSLLQLKKMYENSGMKYRVEKDLIL